MDSDSPEFVYVDLFAAAQFQPEMQTWILGPSNFRGDDAQLGRLSYFIDGGTVHRTVCLKPAAADWFLPIWDDRRIRRIWQEPLFVATTIPSDVLRRSVGTVRFLCSEACSFEVWDGAFSCDQAPGLSSQNSRDRFCGDIPGVPLAVTLKSAGVTVNAVLLVAEEGTDLADRVVVIGSMRSLEHLDWQVFVRGLLVGKFVRNRVRE